MPKKSIRICIVEDHAMVRSALRMVIENHGGMVVVGEASNRAEALKFANANPPDIFVLDLDLGDENGLDFLPELISTFPSSKVLVVTASTDTSEHQRVIKAGAMGLVLKEEASDVLLTAIEKLYSGEAWLTPALTAAVLSQISRTTDNSEDHKIERLTSREREIIALVAQGFKRSQIAEKLFLSETTVRNYMTSILGKLELSDRFELAFYAFRHRLAKPPR
jgi:DNA-binding NarL/FixJ family response regulator